MQNIKNCSNLFSIKLFSPKSPVVSNAIHNKIKFKLNIFIQMLVYIINESLSASNNYI